MKEYSNTHTHRSESFCSSISICNECHCKYKMEWETFWIWLIQNMYVSKLKFTYKWYGHFSMAFYNIDWSMYVCMCFFFLLLCHHWTDIIMFLCCNQTIQTNYSFSLLSNLIVHFVLVIHFDGLKKKCFFFLENGAERLSNSNQIDI